MNHSPVIYQRPALRYHGAKWILAPWIISYFPPHRIYTEVFGGGAGVLLRKPRSYSEVYNDLDGEIVNVFRVMRDKGAALKRYLSLTPFSRDEFLLAYGRSKDPVKMAARTIMKSFMGFGSDSIHNKSGFRADAEKSGTTPARDWTNYVRAMDFFVDRIRGVIIENKDATKVLKQHDELDSLHYVDPPYLHETRRSSKRYRYEMNDEEHIRLAELLRSLKGKVIVSGYPSERYNELYKGWYMTSRNALADGARKRIEVLWMNFQPQRLL